MLQLPPMPTVQVTFCEVPMPWYATPDWLMAIATVVLAIVTGILAVYTARLFKESKLAREQAERHATQASQDSKNALQQSTKENRLALSQADAVSKAASADSKAAIKQSSEDSWNAIRQSRINSDAALAITRESMERSLRAYLIVQSIRVNNLPIQNHHKSPEISIRIVNTGQVPSRGTTLRWRAGVRFGSVDVAQDDVVETVRSLGNADIVELGISFSPSFLIENKLNRFDIGGSKVVFIEGCIQYDDGISNEERRTNFRFLYDGTRVGAIPDPIGNNSIT